MTDPAEQHDASDSAEQLDSARDRLLNAAPPAGWKRRKETDYLTERAVLLIMIEAVRAKPSALHVNLASYAAELFTKAPDPDLEGADTIWRRLRSDSSLFADASDWTSMYQRSQALGGLALLLVGFGVIPIFAIFHDPDSLLTGSVGLLGGLIGCFLDWNRSKPRPLGGGPVHGVFLIILQPFASAISGLLFVLALKSGVLNLKIEAGHEAIYFFLVAVFAGFAGSHGIERLGHSFDPEGRPQTSNSQGSDRGRPGT